MLSRKEGESIVIPGYEIEIIVRRIDGDSCKIGIIAPMNIEVHRLEVWHAIKRANGGSIFHKGQGDRT